MVLTQFQDLVSQYYELLKDLPEFKEAKDIYDQLYLVRKQLAEKEAERLQYYDNLGKASNQENI